MKDLDSQSSITDLRSDIYNKSLIVVCVISVFRREVDENRVLLGYYAADVSVSAYLEL